MFFLRYCDFSTHADKHHVSINRAERARWMCGAWVSQLVAKSICRWCVSGFPFGFPVAALWFLSGFLLLQGTGFGKRYIWHTWCQNMPSIFAHQRDLVRHDARSTQHRCSTKGHTTRNTGHSARSAGRTTSESTKTCACSHAAVPWMLFFQTSSFLCSPLHQLSSALYMHSPT